MSRTPQRHIVKDTFELRAKIRTEAQHVDLLGAQEGDTGLVGIGSDADTCEVLAQVRADLCQDVYHSSGRVRFLPVSASKIVSLDVSNASWTVSPFFAWDSVETRATNSFSPMPDSLANSASWAAWAPAPSLLKCRYLSAPSDSTMSTVTSNVNALIRAYPSSTEASSRCS